MAVVKLTRQTKNKTYYFDQEKQPPNNQCNHFSNRRYMFSGGHEFYMITIT